MPDRESRHSRPLNHQLRTDVVLPKSKQGRLGLGGLLRETLAMADLGLLQAASHKPCRGAAHPGSCGANLQRLKGFHCTQANDSGRPGAFPRGGRLRDPNRLGNLVMPGSLGRAFRWPLSARIIRGVRSPKRTLRIFSRRSVGLWTSSLKRGSPPGWSIPIGRKTRLLWSETMNRPRTGWLTGYPPF